MAEDITNSTNQNDEDFGLPEVDFKPLDQLEEEHQAIEEEPVPETIHENPTPVYEEEEEQRSNSGLVITLIILLIVLGGGGFAGYKYWWVPRQEKAKLAIIAAEREAKEKAKADSLARVAEEEARLKAQVPVKVDGTIETLSERTGRYYVVVSSSVDGDLAMDRAKKMSVEGKSTKIIPPFGKGKYYRLAIGDFDSFASAQSSADASKGEFGNELWVLKY